MNYKEQLQNTEIKSESKRINSQPMSWGTKEDCLDLIKVGMVRFDETIKEFQMLPEYYKIAEWMSGTEGTGLALIGDSGRGKTIFMTKVFPVLYRLWYIENKKIDKSIRAIKSEYLCEKNEEQEGFPYYYKTNVITDEAGREQTSIVEYKKRDLFPLWLDNCIERGWPPYFTTNLNEPELEIRYGIHIVNRIKHACKVVIFKGVSLW
jgi:DNA replication protein DnaC